MSGRLQPGDLVELVNGPFGDDVRWENGSHPGMVGVVVSEAYARFDYKGLYHDVRFPDGGLSCYAACLRKIAGPPADDVDDDKDALTLTDLVNAINDMHRRVVKVTR
jgi:hypothetical protein